MDAMIVRSGVDRLLDTKLNAPTPSRPLITRPRLVALLEGALTARLTLLSAPPGFGKSTALLDWLAASGTRPGWLSLDEADDEPSRFLRYLWAAAALLSGDPASAPSSIGQSVAAPDVIAEIVVLLGEHPGPNVLVLDDYHVLRSAEIHRAVALLLEQLPAQAHLVIASRVDPALPLARLRARGELLEVRAETLRFTTAEAGAFLGERMGVHLSEPDLAALVARTEGWPAVLQLAGLSLAGRDDPSAFVRDFAATHRFVLDYVAEEVLDRLDPDVREFLLQTSVLDRLSGALCDAVTRRTDGRAMLERLERSNLLIVPLDDDRSWYRYHRLFADLLRARLASTEPEALPLLHHRASVWYEEQGSPSEAIEHALRGGDVDRARTLLPRFAPEMIHTGEFAAVRAFIERLSRGRDPGLFLSTMYAWALALSGELDRLDPYLLQIEALLPGARAAGEPVADTAPAHVAMLRSVAARERGDPLAAIAHAERAVTLVPPGLAPEREALTLGDATAILGHALVAGAEFDRAIEAYGNARPLVERAGNWLGVADITRNLARLEVRRGRIRAALEACEQVLERSGARRDSPALAPVHLARAEILERMAAPGVAEAAGRALELARRGGDPVTAREARQLLDRARARGEDTGASRVRLVEPLTERELEVLRLVGAGRSNRQIASELFLALGTVKTHVHAISAKLGASNRVEAVARAREYGLLA